MGLSSPYALVADGHFAITPSDSVNFAAINGKIAEAAIFVGVAGTVTVLSAQGEAVQYTVTNVPYVIPIRARRVNFTGTSASGLVGMY